MRHGKGAEAWFPRYYGTVDATPLYLVLLSEVWRWTGDARLVEDLREPAMRALTWIDEYGDLDGDGFVEYRRRSERGLVNQSWKDSGDSQRFHDGRIADAPIAPCEVQGYVYDAKRRTAELAREVWRDQELADRLDREAEELQARFQEAFWCEGRGGYYALALDGEKRRVDSLTSNIGHLLWSGIVPAERADAIVDQLMGDELWSGWGVRTMSSGDAASIRSRTTTAPSGRTTIPSSPGASPGMHAGPRRTGSPGACSPRPATSAISSPRSSRASRGPRPRSRSLTRRPRGRRRGPPARPCSCSSSSSACGPTRATQAVVSDAPAELPSWLGSLKLSGVRAFDRSWDVRLENGHIDVDAAE